MIVEVSNWRRPPPGLILPSWYPRAERPKHRHKQEGMLWVPKKGNLLVDAYAGGSTFGTAVTTGGSSSTKGSVVELAASTAFDAYWMTVIAAGYAASVTASQAALDILVGAATERVLIANLLAGYAGAVGSAADAGWKVWEFPLYLPAGSRIAAQAAGARTSTAMRVAIWLYGGDGLPPFRTGGKVTTYGMGTVPDGTTVAPGASGAEGSWVQIAASTSEDHFALIPSLQPTADTTLLNGTMRADIGVGSATEEEIAANFIYAYGSNETCMGPVNSMPCFQDIPSGTRLAMRTSRSTAADTSPNCCIHAVS